MKRIKKLSWMSLLKIAGENFLLRKDWSLRERKLFNCETLHKYMYLLMLKQCTNTCIHICRWWDIPQIHVSVDGKTLHSTCICWLQNTAQIRVTFYWWRNIAQIHGKFPTWDNKVQTRRTSLTNIHSLSTTVWLLVLVTLVELWDNDLFLSIMQNKWVQRSWHQKRGCGCKGRGIKNEVAGAKVAASKTRLRVHRSRHRKWGCNTSSFI